MNCPVPLLYEGRCDDFEAASLMALSPRLRYARDAVLGVWWIVQVDDPSAPVCIEGLAVDCLGLRPIQPLLLKHGGFAEPSPDTLATAAQIHMLLSYPALAMRAALELDAAEEEATDKATIEDTNRYLLELERFRRSRISHMGTRDPWRPARNKPRKSLLERMSGQDRRTLAEMRGEVPSVFDQEWDERRFHSGAGFTDAELIAISEKARLGRSLV